MEGLCTLGFAAGLVVFFFAAFFLEDDEAKNQPMVRLMWWSRDVYITAAKQRRCGRTRRLEIEGVCMYTLSGED
jgi:hypothetical protein